MLNMVPLKDAKRAEEYFGKSDGGYYITVNSCAVNGVAGRLQGWA